MFVKEHLALFGLRLALLQSRGYFIALLGQLEMIQILLKMRSYASNSRSI